MVFAGWLTDMFAGNGNCDQSCEYVFLINIVRVTWELI